MNLNKKSPAEWKMTKEHGQNYGRLISEMITENEQMTSIIECFNFFTFLQEQIVMLSECYNYFLYSG